MNRPFEVDSGDREGKTWFRDWLSKRGYTVTDTDDVSKFMHFDLLAKKDNTTLWIELKNRDCASYTWGDLEIQLDKYNFLLGAPDKAILVYFWSDAWTMIDVKQTQPTKIYAKYAQHSHRWNRQKEMKKFVLWDTNKCNIRLLPYD